MTPGCQVRVVRDHMIGDRLTGRLGTYVGDSPDGKWRLVTIPGIGAPRHFPPEQLEEA